MLRRRRGRTIEEVGGGDTFVEEGELEEVEVEVDEQVVMTKIMIQVNTTIRVTIVASGSGRWEMDGKYCRSYRNECQRRMTFGNLERVPPTST